MAAPVNRVSGAHYAVSMAEEIAGQPAAQSHGGVFIVFEGGDGAGKTTQIKALVPALEAEGHTVTATHEPGGTPLGIQIRRLLLHGGVVTPEAEALLFAADRAQHVAGLIRPALARGEVVVSDRYADSTLAYQGAREELLQGRLRELSTFATGGLVPHLTVLLDVTPEVGRSRRGATADRIESAPEAYHRAVRANFLALAREAPKRYLVLDAGLPVEQIAGQVLARVRGLLAGSGRGANAPERRSRS